MRRFSFALAAALASTASALPSAPAARPKLDKIRNVLDYGLWNDRIDALYDLDSRRRDAMPLLVYADDDADWQVRLTSVRFLGKLGPSAAPSLGDVARREPCPHVRLLALLLLSRMGPAGEKLYAETATSADRKELSSLPKKYSPDLMGKPLLIDVPGEMTAKFFRGGVDRRACASSEHAGRLHRHRKWRPVSAAARERVVTPDVPLAARKDLPAAKKKQRPAPAAPRAADVSPEQRRRNAEIDAFLAPNRAEQPAPKARLLASAAAPISSLGTPGSFPPGRPAPARAPREKPSGRYEKPDARSLASSAVPASSSGTPGSFPPGSPAAAPAARAKPSGRYEKLDARTLASSAVPGSSSGTPGSFPPGLPAPAPASHAAPAGPSYENPDARTLATASVPAVKRKLPPPESFPRGPAAPAPRAEDPAEVDFVADAGTGKMENDPVPTLIAQLSNPESRRRARAADELGKRGAAAVPAIPALRRALRDVDRRVRASAALALGNCGGSVSGVAADLRRALRDKDEDVRFSAGVALERIKTGPVPGPNPR